MIGWVSVSKAALGKAEIMLMVAEHLEDDGRNTKHDK